MRNRRNSLWLLNIVLLVIGTFTGRAIFYEVAILLVMVLILAGIWSWLAVRGVRIGRQTRTRRSQVGRNFTEVFSVRNTLFVPKLWLEVRDHSDLPGHHASHVVPTLRARQQYEWRVETPCIVRGEFQLGPLTIISGDPFGLFLTPRRIPASERMIVYPQVLPLRNFKLPASVVSGGEPQRYITQNITTNAAGVRDYVAGDSINRIHWKSTARRGKLFVKEFEIDPMVDVWLVCDFSTQSLYEDTSVQRTGQTGVIMPNSRQIPASTEEYSVVIAASLANYFVEKERAMGFLAHTPHRTLYQPERGHRQLTRILETLAVARSHTPYPFRETLSRESHNLSRGTTAVIITSSIDPAFVDELQLLSRRGIRSMCIYVDPTSFGLRLSSDEIRGRLQLAKIPTITVRMGDDLAVVLQQRAI